MNNQQQKRTYNCMQHHDKKPSDLNHLVLLNEHLNHRDGNNVSNKKRKINNTKQLSNSESQQSRMIIEEDEQNVYDDFYKQMERRMELLCARMNRTLKQQEEAIRIHSCKPEKSKNSEENYIERRNSDERIWTTLCGMYSLYTIHNRKY